MARLVCEGGLTKLLDQPGCHISFPIRGGGESPARFSTCDFTDSSIQIDGRYRT